MAGEDAARRYWKWRKWAKAYLTLLEAKGTPKEANGSALFCLLDGPAELALEGRKRKKEKGKRKIKKEKGGPKLEQRQLDNSVWSQEGPDESCGGWMHVGSQEGRRHQHRLPTS